MRRFCDKFGENQGVGTLEYLTGVSLLITPVVGLPALTKNLHIGRDAKTD